MTCYGADCGTFNLVVCSRNGEGNFVYKKEVNAFIQFPIDNDFVFQMMKKSGIPLIEREKVAYALGEAAVNMASTWPTIELRRPMKDGCVNPYERDAFQILSIMVHSLMNDVHANDRVYFTVPSNAINKETDADYHRKVLEAIFAAYKDEKGQGIKAFPINEGLALVYAELASSMYTGFGISFGAGMVNVCFAMYGKDIFKFSIANSGDWIDKQAAKATGESVAFINKEKAKIDLTKEPNGLIERAISMQYRLMIEKTVSLIKQGLEENVHNKVKLDTPVNIVIAGGTSLPSGFDKLFTETIKAANLPINVGEVIKPKDALFSVARGALLAAEASMQ